jgi:hypothetical protein
MALPTAPNNAGSSAATVASGSASTSTTASVPALLSRTTTLNRTAYLPDAATAGPTPGPYRSRARTSRSPRADGVPDA